MKWSWPDFRLYAALGALALLGVFGYDGRWWLAGACFLITIGVAGWEFAAAAKALHECSSNDDEMPQEKRR